MLKGQLCVGDKMSCTCQWSGRSQRNWLQLRRLKRNMLSGEVLKKNRRCKLCMNSQVLLSFHSFRKKILIFWRNNQQYIKCAQVTVKFDLPDSHFSEEFSRKKRGIPWFRQPNTVTLAPFRVDCGRKHEHMSFIPPSNHQPSAAITLVELTLLMITSGLISPQLWVSKL